MFTVARFCKSWSLADIFGAGQWCPVCGGTDFTYTEGDAVYCDRCNAKFTLRMTCGDDGVVVDCHPATADTPVLVLRPTRNPQRPDVQPYFYQVLKTCEGGLADRDRWCHNLDLRGPNRDADWSWEDITRDEFPQGVGTEVFWYDPVRVARHRTWQQWRRSKAGQSARQLGSYEAQCKYIDYEHRHMPQHEAAVRAAGHQRGLYPREWCQETFPQDGYVVHGCIPLAGAVPLPQRTAEA